MNTNCNQCKQHTSTNDIFLLNGESVHKNCLDKLRSKNTIYDELIHFWESQVKQLTVELESHNRLFSRLTRFFSTKSLEDLNRLKQKYDRSKNLTSSLIENRNEVLRNRSLELTKVYDYWMERPPDWQQRRMLMVQKRRKCSACNRKNKVLHVHHIKPISEGGNHTFENLEVLCVDCHSLAHGGIQFISHKNSTRKGRFERTTDLMRYAIEHGLAVKMTYIKTNQERSTRVIHPNKLFTIKVSGNLCVQGFCTLRQNARVFAIKRIKKSALCPTGTM